MVSEPGALLKPDEEDVATTRVFVMPSHSLMGHCGTVLSLIAGQKKLWKNGLWMGMIWNEIYVVGVVEVKTPVVEIEHVSGLLVMGL